VLGEFFIVENYKNKNLYDEETIQTIRENPYMQYVLGLSEFTDKLVFDSSLFVIIRKCIGKDDFNDMGTTVGKPIMSLKI
jgi:transposase, IS5 family